MVPAEVISADLRYADWSLLPQASNIRTLREHPPLRSQGADTDDDGIPPAYFVDDYDSEDDPAFVESSSSKPATASSKQKPKPKKKARKDDIYDVRSERSPDPHPLVRNLRSRQAPMPANMKTRSRADQPDADQSEPAVKAPKKTNAATSAIDRKPTPASRSFSSIPASKPLTSATTSRLPSYRHTPYGTIASKSTMLKAYHKETMDASFSDIADGQNNKKKKKLAPPVGDDDEEELLWFD